MVGMVVLDGQVARMAFFPTKPKNQRLSETASGQRAGHPPFW